MSDFFWIQTSTMEFVAENVQFKGAYLELNALWVRAIKQVIPDPWVQPHDEHTGYTVTLRELGFMRPVAPIAADPEGKLPPHWEEKPTRGSAAKS